MHTNVPARNPPINWLIILGENLHNATVIQLTLLGPVIIKINTVLANFNNTRPSSISNN